MYAGCYKGHEFLCTDPLTGGLIQTSWPASPNKLFRASIDKFCFNQIKKCIPSSFSTMPSLIEMCSYPKYHSSSFLYLPISWRGLHTPRPYVFVASSEASAHGPTFSANPR